MENYLVLSAGGPWYELFYNIAFLAVLGVLLFEAHKRKIPMLKWVVLIIITRILFIAGTKLITFGYAEWYELFTRFRFPAAPGKSLLGGMLFGMAGWLGGYYLLRFRHNIADAFAMALPLGIAIQRFGCFFTGCCYGKPCSLPWAVQYPVNTLPHYHQFSDSLLTHQDMVSLPVHPVQLYEAAGLIAALFVLVYFRKRLRMPGSLLLLSFILMFAARFVSEFFRDIQAHVIGGTLVGAFNTTQLVLAPVIVVLLLFLVLRERQPVGRQVVPEYGSDLEPGRGLLLLSVLALLFLCLKQWFDITERAVMLVTFAVAFSVPAWRLVLRFSRKPLKWVYLAGFILPFFFLSQTYKENVQDSVLVKKYKTLKVGFGTGDFDNLTEITSGTGCDTHSTRNYYRQEYKLAAAAFEFTEEKPRAMKKFSYGAKMVFGNQQETLLPNTRPKEYLLVDVAPYVKWETNWLGIGGGMHMGNLNFITEDLSKEGKLMPESGNVFIPIYPQAYLRVGPYKWLFADYHLADHFPSALPGFRQQLGVGTGLGMLNYTSLRVGSNLGSMTYLSGYFPINKFVFEPTLIWGESPYSQNGTRYQFSFGLSYRFGLKEELKAE